MRQLNMLAIACVFLLSSCNTKSDEQKTILLYCAAGIKPAIEQIAKNYEEEYKVRVDIQYGGSGTLLANLRIAKQGDLYLAADESYVEEAKKFGLIAESQPLAILTPTIAVKKRNPKNIKGINDLFNSNVRVSLGNPDAASIGKQTKLMFEKQEKWEELKDNVTVFKPTVNDVATDVRLETVDAGIVWDATVNQFDDLESIAVDFFQEYKKEITLGVLKFTEQPTEALKFLRYVSSYDKGAPIFKANGYNPIHGDKWDTKPEILFFSGGVNRIAIEETIKKFEEREGVQVIRVYNGCGILVSQIKAGEKPDAYLSCDVSFMDEVQADFTNVENISNTRIVIATQKGNPFNIKTFEDLAGKDIRIGVCNPQQSALGALTQNMLKRKSIWDKIEPNIYSQTPTADLLVNQIRTSSLDAVIVYEANLSQVKDKLTMVSIDDDDAMAIQNIGLGAKTEYPYLTTRLFDAIMGDESKEIYLNNGFQWANKID
ncbi:MAG: molybdate ABC transporter substrate-binding protein [Bacteroidetes bacterium]|nr:molybdate ABC transporter substrate-binding protein [Bacteroidota bacterium]